MKRYLFVTLLILLVALLVGCSSQVVKTAVVTDSDADKSGQAYPPADATAPASQQAVQGPYPYPYPGPNPTSLSHQPAIDYNAMPYIPPQVEAPGTATPSLPIVVPTPKTDSGIVIGKLLSSDSGNPPYMATLFLGSTITADKSDFPPLVSLHEDIDPKGTQDTTGAFVFTDIAPGIYAIIVWDPYASVVIQDEAKENYRTFEVKAGEITDLGTILYP